MTLYNRQAMALGSFFYDNMIASFLVDSMTLKIFEVNARCLAMFGYSKTEFQDRLKVTDLCSPKERSMMIRCLELAGNNTRPARLSLVRKNRTTFEAIVYVKAAEFYGRPCAFVTTLDNNEILLSSTLPGCAASFLEVGNYEL